MIYISCSSVFPHIGRKRLYRTARFFCEIKTVSNAKTKNVSDTNFFVGATSFEPHHEKTGFFHMRKQDADQLRGDREADQRLCFHYMDSTIPLLPNSKLQAASHLLWLYSLVCVGPGQKP